MAASTWSLIESGIEAYQQYDYQQDVGIYAQDAYEVQAAQSERAAEWAQSQADVNNYKLKRTYNETLATQAATFAAQGRNLSSGSIKNIIASDYADLEWDLAYNESTADFMIKGYQEDSANFIKAGEVAKSTADDKATAGLIDTGTSVIGEILDSTDVVDTVVDYGSDLIDDIIDWF